MLGELFFGRHAVAPAAVRNEGCMKVSHTLLNSVNPIRFSRIRLGVSNHLILIITLNAWNLLQPLTMGMLPLF